jgi:hypothetical protein
MILPGTFAFFFIFDLWISFEIKELSNEEGTITLNVEGIAPGEHQTVNVTVVAKLYGMYDSTRASVRYTSVSSDEDADSESEDNQFQGLSSSLIRTKILSKDEYQRVSSYYARDWIIFVALTAVTTIIPFGIWKSKNAETSAWSKKRK